MNYQIAMETIGNTPLLAIPKLCQKAGATAQVLVKLEKNNPYGSVKDRAGLYIIREQSGG
ncbi:MAG: pyridoxal-phosphate dependent enzyme [Christensenellales bacterium]